MGLSPVCVCLFLYYTTVLLAVNDMDVHVEGGGDVVWSLSWCYVPCQCTVRRYSAGKAKLTQLP